MTTAATTAAGLWTQDPQESTASFIAPHLLSRVRGGIPFRAATVKLGNQGEAIRATAELELTAIDTGNPRRDRDFAKPHLLNTHRNPTLAVTMDSCGTTVTGWTAQATITARGRTCPASLVATRISAATDSTQRTRIQGSYDRSLLGLHTPGFIKGRHICVELFAEFLSAPGRHDGKDGANPPERRIFPAAFRGDPRVTTCPQRISSLMTTRRHSAERFPRHESKPAQDYPNGPLDS